MRHNLAKPCLVIVRFRFFRLMVTPAFVWSYLSIKIAAAICRFHPAVE